jgi:GT2 family glycosyltransferase
MTSEITLNGVGVVVIGRNEGQRLVTCLKTVAALGDRVVYVDSGSSDGSVAMARGLGLRVVELDLSKPFTAARARNAGLAELVARASVRQDFVQFIDGDCELSPGWLERAVTFLRARPDVAVACGRCRERYPENSLYNKLCDIEWDTPIGEASGCGGIAMMRTSALAEVGGFNPDVVAGEDSELCTRLRNKGHKIWRLDAEMNLHDAAILHFGQWWKRSVRLGYAYAQVAWMRRNEPDHMWRDELVRTVVWGAVLPIAIILLAFVRLEALALFALYPLQVYRIAAKRDIADPASWYYAFATAIPSKVAGCLGILTYLKRCWLDNPVRLIEYKSAS